MTKPATKNHLTLHSSSSETPIKVLQQHCRVFTSFPGEFLHLLSEEPKAKEGINQRSKREAGEFRMEEVTHQELS